MARGTLIVAPEMLAHVMTVLPSTVRVVGSEKMTDNVALALAGESLPAGMLLGITKYDGARTVFELVAA